MCCMPVSVFSMSDSGQKKSKTIFVFSHTQIKSNQSLSHFGHPIPTERHPSLHYIVTFLLLIDMINNYYIFPRVTINA